jgi:hypothetical protein
MKGGSSAKYQFSSKMLIIGNYAHGLREEKVLFNLIPRRPLMINSPPHYVVCGNHTSGSILVLMSRDHFLSTWPE